MNTVPITDATFKAEVLESPVPVLVDFWAPWCGPCRMVAPILEQMAAEYQGRVKIVKLDTDENPGVAAQLGIRAIPTLILFKQGRVVDSHVGVASPLKLRDMLDRALN